MSNNRFNAPEPIFGKEHLDKSAGLVATEKNSISPDHIDNPDQFEDIGQTTYTASWTTPIDCSSRSAIATITLPSDPGSNFRVYEPERNFEIQARSGSPGSYTWAASSGWAIYVSYHIERVKTLIAVPSSSIAAGTYRFALKANTFGTGNPSAAIPSTSFSIGASVSSTTFWGPPLVYLNDHPSDGRGRYFITAAILPVDFQRNTFALHRNGVQLQRRYETTDNPSGYDWEPATTDEQGYPDGSFVPTIRIHPRPESAYGTYRFIYSRGIFSFTPRVPSADDISPNIHIPASVDWDTPAYCSTSNTVTTIISLGSSGNVRTGSSFRGVRAPIGITTNSIEVRNELNTATITGWTHVITRASPTSSDYTIVSTPPANTNGIFRFRIKANSLTINYTDGTITRSETSGNNEVSRGVLVQGEDMPSITIDSGRFDADTRRITWMAYLSVNTPSQLTQLTSSDITVNRSDTSLTLPTVSVTRTPSGGSSYRIQTSPIATGNTGDLTITIQANALGANSNPYAVTSGCVYYDTRTIPPTVPAVTITSGGTSGRTAYLYVYWENATDTQLGMFDSADITITGATGASATVGTRMGGAFPVTIANLPANTNGNFKIRIRANALGTGTNVVTDSTCIGYDTRTTVSVPQLVISSGGFCPTSNVISWTVTAINTSSTQFTALDTADITVNDSLTSQSPALNGRERIVNRGGKSLVVEVPVPSGRNGNASITIAANAVGTSTNASVTSSCVNYDTRAATVATASWGTPTAQTGENAVLQGRVTFATTTNVQDIEPGDFDIITTGNAVHPEASWTIQVSHSYTNSSRAYIDVTAIPTGTFNASFGFRLKSSSVRSGGSSTLNAPAANVNSSLVAFNNTPATTDDPDPSVTITSGGFDGDDTVYFYMYWENATTTQLNTLVATDITVEGAGDRRMGSTGAGYIVTLGTRMGNSYPFTVSNLPTNMNTTLKATVVANAIGTNTNVATDSSCIPYDTRTVDDPVPTVTITSGGFDGDDTVFFYSYWENVTVAQVNNFAADANNVTVSGAGSRRTGQSTTGYAISLGTRMGFAVPFTVTGLPANMNTTLKATIIANAAGTDTNAATESSCIPYDTLTTAPFVTITSGGFDGNDTVFFYSYWENTTGTELANFTIDDILVSGAGDRNTAADGDPPNGYVVTMGSRMGFAAPFTISNLPANMNTTLKVRIRANALGTNTNIATESSCIPYDTRTISDPDPSATITSGGFDGDDTVFFYAYWENATTTELTNFTDADISVTGAGTRNTAADGQPPNGYVVTLGSPMGSAYPFNISNLPANMNTTLKATIRANALGSDTNDAIESSCIPYDTTVPTPTVTITSGGFDGDDTVFFYAYWENATATQLGSFDADDITVTGAGSKRGMDDTTGYVVTVGSRMGLAVPFNITGLPTGRNGTLKATIRANAIGTNTNVATESSCIPYDTTTPVEPDPSATITSGGFDGDDTVFFYSYWENATATELALFTAEDISVTGAGDRNTAADGQPPNGYVVTLGSAMGSAYPFNISNLPANMNTTLKATIRANALGSNTNAAIESSCIPYDTTIPRPTVTITSGGFDGDDTVFFYAYWENTTGTALDDSSNGFDADDITVAGAGSKRGTGDTTGYVVTVGTRMGLAKPFSISGLPANTNSTLKVTIRANALGTGTNVAAESSCIPYDTTGEAESPYLIVSGLPTVEQTGSSFSFNFTGQLDGSDIDMQGLTASDFIVTSPDGNITPTLS